MKMLYATLAGEIEHRFTCFLELGMDRKAVIAFVDEVEAWAKARGHCERRNDHVLKVYGDDLAMELKLRWC